MRKYDRETETTWHYILYNDGSEELHNNSDMGEPISQDNIDYELLDGLRKQLVKDLGLNNNTVGMYDKKIPRKCQTWCAKNKNPWKGKCKTEFKECNSCPQCKWEPKDQSEDDGQLS